ncbi:MAG: DUF2264 domain-containing protein [Verrucomicrobia bacterium]|nr:DUF2264 domain-containing protein [Verrucomicrobiota bacterium]MCH8529038.1 DUF2264 domain-containing protein [Kiritimatiellia bacterium]
MNTSPETTRLYWIDALERVVSPVFRSLARGTLREDLPVETAPDAKRNPQDFTHLEAVGRSLCGISPWLVCPGLDGDEAARRDALLADVVTGLNQLASQVNFTDHGKQPVVDAAFLAQGLLRAGPDLWNALSDSGRADILTGLRATRKHVPHFNNWLLFSATIEAFFESIGEPADPMRIDYALRQHEQWYLGDGVYGDGPPYHCDYYNSYVIHPMLVDIVEAVEGFKNLRERILPRARRHAVIQERQIAPDGSFPPVGRSLCYRAGAFHLLAQQALRDDLPDSLPPAQVRDALTAVLRRTLDAPGTFDAGGWLTLGLAGHQPSLAEGYISTGSLYLCSAAFLPLGLPPAHPFWSGPETPWTSCRIWQGDDLPRDKAL